MRNIPFRRGAMAAAIVAALAVGASATQVLTPADAAQGAPLVTGLPDFSPLVGAAGPAVVAVSTRQEGADAQRGFAPPPGMSPDDPFFRFFGQIPWAGRGEREAPAQGIGSGFIVSADGYILTNAHVVADADAVKVHLTDKREFDATVVGLDRKSDIALLKIDADGLPTVRVGDPARLRVGEWVAAIGSPFGLENTVTAGIVSAKSRELPEDAYVPFIQSDVPINPGNSGGPLLNMRGEVVGVNSQIYSRSGGYMGLSFSIPIDVAMRVGDELRAHGRVERGLLGVTVQTVTKELAESFGLDTASGALVSGVAAGSAAAAAGVRPGDVIVAMEGKAIASAADLSRFVADTRPGVRASLEVVRDGKPRKLAVEVGRAGEDAVASAGDPAAAAQSGRLGVRVRPLAEHELGATGGQPGLVVQDASGPAAKAGIEPGDVILGVNSRRVHDVADLKAAIEAGGERVALLVRRGDGEMFVPVDLG